jgi:myo-inositol-1(or 4)-monophosphatase
LSQDLPPLDFTALSADLAARVIEAGELALSFYNGDAQRWTKQDNSPVTEADLAVDRFLRERLPPLVPDAAWLSEETADSAERLSAARVWIVDPIDGTRSFINRIPEWVISVALVENGAPVAALVHNPCTGETYSAVRGSGATLNGTPIAVSPGDDLDGKLVAGPALLLDALSVFGVKRSPWIHALANRFAQVSDGRLDAAVARDKAYDWDIAAAHLLITEAGGVLTGVSGEVPRYNQPVPRHEALIASSRSRHATLLESMQVAARIAAELPDSPI